MTDTASACVDCGRFGRRSIQVTVGITIVVITTLLLSALGALDYLSTQRSMRAGLENNAGLIARRLSTALVVPLWDMAKEPAEGFLDSEMAEPAVAGLLIRDDAGAVFAGRQRTPEWQAVSADEITPGGLLATTADIIKDGAKIGSVEVFLTPKLMQAALGSSIANIVLRILLIDFILVVALSLSLRRSLILPLRAIQDFALHVSREDFDYHIKGRFRGELADLKRSLEQLVVSMREKMVAVQDKEREAQAQAQAAMRSQAASEQAHREAEARREELLRSAARLREVADKVDAASRELYARMSEASRGAGEQKGRVEETFQAMEDLASTILEVAGNASATAEHADTARSTAEGGARVVGQAVAAIEEVKRESATLRVGMEDLGRQVEGIGNIMGVISDIADQTNLLALNAAIEAARAGDAGRGFAVVASEVRKLAEKTMSATHEVERVIQSVRSGTRTNIDATEHAARAVEKANALALDSGQALREIVRLVSRTSDQIRSVVATVDRQSTSSEQIRKAMEEVTAIATGTADGMGSSTHAVSDLAGLAEELGEMVRRMQGL